MRFKPGDRVRRDNGKDVFGNVVAGGEYTVEWCQGVNLRLVGHDYIYADYRFSLVEPCTPAELFEAIEGFVKAILREPPMRVGNVYRHDDTGIKRTILCIHNDYVWLSDEDSTPFTGHARALLEHYTRITI